VNFRNVRLPVDIRGKLYLHSMPGRHEALADAWAEVCPLYPESGHAQRPHQYPLVPIADIDNGNQRNLLVLIRDH